MRINNKFSVNRDDAVQYTFIENFRGDPQEITAGALTVIKNGVSNVAAFRLQAFVFSGLETNEVFLHCSTRLCDSTAEECDTSSGNRKRRGVLKFTEDHQEVYTMTSGPIKFTE